MDRSAGVERSDTYLDEFEETSVVRRSIPARQLEATRVEVDLGAVVANVRDVQELLGPSRGILAMLKADAYGHGLVPVARALARDGLVAGLVVSSVQDGLLLRRERVAGPIIAMAASYATAHGEVLDAGLVPVVSSIADFEAFAHAARVRGMRAPLHLKLDTGMARLGLREDEIAPLLALAARNPHVHIEGLCTHLASADSDSAAATDRQLDVFERACDRFCGAGHRPSTLHVANTAATFRHPRSLFSHVRIGIALFGGDEPSGVRLRPAMRFVTNIAQLRWIGPGETASYSNGWQAARPSRIATLPVGYAHGYPRRLFGRGEVLVRGRRCPVIGAICMEMILVDVTDLGAAVQVGEEAVLIGADGADEIRATDVARAIDGIVEEVFCGISKTVPREYGPHGLSLEAGR